MTKAPRTIETALRDAESRYARSHPLSRERFETAAAFMPGGNTRSVIHFSPFPFVVERAGGQRLYDVDGHVYVDFLGEFSAGIYGHSHPAIMTAAREALAGGLSFGAPNRYEAELAETMCKRFPSCEMVRFCNSGTEANLMAIATARAVTGRSKIMVMDGGYHGSVLKFAGGGAVTNVPYEFVVATYNDLPGTLGLIKQHGTSIAALLVEPIMGSAGCVAAEQAFLDGLREATARHGIVLIFDEVMSSRLSYSGLQGALGLTPDLTTFGKYVGGGFSFGAFGGRRELMSVYDPRLRDGLTHAGTFNNNVMSMKAGLTGLRDVYGQREAAALNKRGEWFRSELNRIAMGRQVGMQAIGRGSMMSLHFQRGAISRPGDIAPEMAKRALLHLSMLEAGYSLARRGFMTLSLALEQADYDGFLSAFDGFTREYADLI
jgi:glutamate-1-semialdehyde 2,1-aminomutase